MILGWDKIKRLASMPKSWKNWDKNKKRPFVFTIKTTGSPETFALPLEASGTYDFRINWGDYKSDYITVWNDAAVTHSYASAGTHTVTITGIIQGWRFNNGGDCAKIYDVMEWGPLRVGNNNGYFYGCSNLTVSAIDMFDLTNITNLSHAFRNCSSLITLDTSGWDMSNITGLLQTFFNCSSLVTLDVSGWDVGNITDFRYLFYGCSSLATLDVSGWNVSSVTSFSHIFYNCSTLTTLNVSSWDTGSIVDFDHTFYSCSSLVTLDVSSWDMSSATTISHVFNNCSSLVTLDVSGWDMSNVTNFHSAFYNCSSLTNPAINNWDITSVTEATSFMSGAKALSVAVYDATLIAWEAQVEQPNVTIHFDASKYTAGGAAATARAALVANGWIITDGGVA